MEIKRRIKFNSWGVISTIIVLMVLLPNLDIIFGLFNLQTEGWNHIRENLLKDYIITTFFLVIITVLLTLVIGVSLAYLISLYDFPLRNFLKWVLILPLAVPPYIGAYTYSGMLSYTGFIQIFFRDVLEFNIESSYFDIMNFKGAVFIFTIFLFPYVYMVTKAFLEKQSSGIIESARLLGSTQGELFTRIIIPLCRSAMVAGGTLVAFEVISDYGVVSYFGIHTFSTAIFKSWISFKDIDSSIRLAGILMVGVLIIMLFEKVLRGRRKYSFSSTKIRPFKRKKLKGIYKIMATAFGLVIFSLGFLIPVFQMIIWSIMSFKNIYYSHFLGMIINTVYIATICSLIIVILSLIVANYTRLRNNLLSKSYSKIILIGYSIPGSVVAITMILFFVNLEERVGIFYLSTSLVMLIFGYVVRYMSVGYQNIEEGYEKIGNKYTEASRTLGYSITESFFKIDLPLLKTSIVGAFALTFVDIVKELPLALNLRPFNFYTLSTKVFEYANDEMIPESSIPSLIIVLISFIAILALNKFMEGRER